jgi:hypothetical protein
MTERNIINALTQKDSHVHFHPNRAHPYSTAPHIKHRDLMNNLQNIGITHVSEIPLEFDWRKQPGVILTPVQNQGHCGNCWAISSTQSFADRWMIATGKTGLVLDPLATTVCAKPGNGCGGGRPESCEKYFVDVGASHSDDKCMSWSEWCKKTPNCCEGCNETNSKNKPDISCAKLGCSGGFKAKQGLMRAGTVLTDYGEIDREKTIHFIKTDIMLHGPIVGKYQVFADFMTTDAGLVTAEGKTFSWKSTNDIYINGQYDNELSQSFQQLAKSTQSGDTEKIKALTEGLMPSVNTSGQIVGESPSKKSMGFHAVEIIGWGVDDKWGEYWIVKNSWGDKWNGDGYFKFGINNDGVTNATCAMDIPIKMKDGLFGGTVSFIPVGDNSRTSGTSVTSKWWFWVIVSLTVLALLYFIFTYFRNKGGRSLQSTISHYPLSYSPTSL